MSYIDHTQQSKKVENSKYPKIVFNLRDVNKADFFTRGLSPSVLMYQRLDKGMSMYMITNARHRTRTHNFLNKTGEFKGRKWIKTQPWGFQGARNFKMLTVTPENYEEVNYLHGEILLSLKDLTLSYQKFSFNSGWVNREYKLNIQDSDGYIYVSGTCSTSGVAQIENENLEPFRFLITQLPEIRKKIYT